MPVAAPGFRTSWMIGGGSVGACAARNPGRISIKSTRIEDETPQACIAFILESDKHGADDCFPLGGARGCSVICAECGAPARRRHRRSAAVVSRTNDDAGQAGADDAALPQMDAG